jgi:APA family basic amino acid/polyamine antiporter
MRHVPVAPDARSPLRGKVDSFTAACVLISNIVGGGIFTVTGLMARDLGDPILILAMWVIGGCLAMAAAISYSELPAALPYAGGDYVYLREAYGSLVGFLSGWVSFTVGFGAGIAAAAVSFASYMLRLMPVAEENSVIFKCIALILIWTITAVHAWGTKAGGRLQRVLTITKVMAILVFLVAGFAIGDGQWSHLTESHAQPASGGDALISALIFVMYTYLGWNVVGYIAGEIADPQRAIPTIVIGGTALVTGLYLLLNLLYLYALPVKALTDAPILPVAEKSAAALFGPGGARFVAALLCVGIAGGVSAMIWAGPHVYRAMALDGVFPTFLSALSAQTGVPLRASLLQGLWVSLLILTGTFEQVVLFSGFILSVFTALAIGAVIVLRRRHPELTRPFRVPLYPALPLLAIGIFIMIVATSVVERPLESTVGVLIVLTGLPLYAFWKTGRDSDHDKGTNTPA